MAYDTDQHHRRSLRLPGYDYSRGGAYFVTVCTHHRACLFGEIRNDEMHLNNAGWMVQMVWDALSDHYPHVELDVFVVMPNHIHGIIVLVDQPVGAGPRACPNGHRPAHGQPQGVAPTMSLPDVVHRFKTMTTKRYADGVKQSGWPPFNGRLWQRNYFEHIIRDDHALNQIREYIVNNPLQWAMDRENPDAAIWTVGTHGRTPMPKGEPWRA